MENVSEKTTVSPRLEWLHTLPMRIAISCFAVVILLGLVAAEGNIYFQVAPIDGKAGLSLHDVRLQFAGGEGPSLLGVMIDGEMRPNLGDNEAQRVKNGQIIHKWIDANAPENIFHRDILPILKPNCVDCHSPGGTMERSPLVTYDDAARVARPRFRAPMDYGRLSVISHIHLFGMGLFVFILAVLFNVSRFPMRIKALLTAIPFVGIVLNIGSWWLARFAPAFVYTIAIGGGMLTVGSIALALLLLIDQWLPRKQLQPVDADV